MNLSSFNGSDAVKEQLCLLEKRNRLPHAVIIEGASHEKRAELCDLLAMWAVCTAETEKPCGVCRSCLNAKNHRHSDVKIVEGSGKTDCISVDAIRDLTADCAVIPNEADVKVYIIYNADKKMSVISQNAFLKTLEEPPADALFLLTCEDGGAMLETVRSRAAVFSLESAREYNPQELELARRAALAVVAGSEYELLKILGGIKTAAQADIIFEIISDLFRDALAAACGGSAQTDAQTAEQLAKQITRGKLLALIDIISDSRMRLKQNVNINLLTTRLCAELRRTVWQK